MRSSALLARPRTVLKIMCAQATLSDVLPENTYLVEWFDTISGEWIKTVPLTSDKSGKVVMPDFPGGLSVSDRDWAVKLKAVQ